MRILTHFADITDSGQYILQEAFTKVSHELEAAQEDLSTIYLVCESWPKGLEETHLATSTVYSFLEVIPYRANPCLYHTSLGPWQ